jgi:hypothetical protein
LEPAHRTAGLGWAGWAGWAGLAGLAGLGWLGWLGLQKTGCGVPEDSVPFGRGPRAVGPQPRTFFLNIFLITESETV